MRFAKTPQKFFEISDKSAYSAVMAEFLTFKKIMWALVKSEKNIGFRAAWAHIKSNYGAQLPRILLMVYVFLVIPCHTAIVERGFSLHRIIKNRLRNSMIICTLDSLMRMSLMAPNPINKFDLN